MSTGSSNVRSNNCCGMKGILTVVLDPVPTISGPRDFLSQDHDSPMIPGNLPCLYEDLN